MAASAVREGDGVALLIGDDPCAAAGERLIVAEALQDRRGSTAGRLAGETVVVQE